MSDVIKLLNQKYAEAVKKIKDEERVLAESIENYERYVVDTAYAEYQGGGVSPAREATLEKIRSGIRKGEQEIEESKAEANRLLAYIALVEKDAVRRDQLQARLEYRDAGDS